MNSYTGEIVDELGDFTNAGFYYAPRFTGTETAFSVVEGQETDDQGNAVIDPNADARTDDDHSSYNYYRETIPVANTIPDYNFGVTSWF
jgi:N-acetyl-gamma-glutamylphosphate reductase